MIDFFKPTHNFGFQVLRLVAEAQHGGGDVFDIARLCAGLELDDKARTWLANRGYDPAYGARPLKRVIQRHVQDPLAEQILAGRVHDGDTVRIGVRDGELSLNGEPVKAAA